MKPKKTDVFLYCLCFASIAFLCYAAKSPIWACLVVPLLIMMLSPNKRKMSLSEAVKQGTTGDYPDNLGSAMGKSRKSLISITDILGNISKWIVIQSPYIPDKLQSILTQAKERLLITKEFIRAYQDNLGFIEMDCWEIKDYLDPILRSIPEYMELNLSKNEKDKGIKVDDPTRPAFVATSRFDGPEDDDAIVDLDALIHNICSDIIKGHRDLNPNP